ncbi:MAG: sensor histidine kinase, partial [Dongiaceae bacterium]
PLNAIIGFSDTLRREIFGPIVNERYRQYVSDIHDSGEHLLALINDILDLSKAEAGKIELHEEVVDVAGAIGDCIHMLRNRVEESGIELVSKISPNLPPIRADERMLKQILLNLLSNAVKFTPPSGRITVDAELKSEAMRLVIGDTGIGIAPQDIAKVMEPFGQVQLAFCRGHTGTGLGLPLARRLAEAHGAKFDLQSELGIGTVVTIDLPRRRVLEWAA